LINLKDLYNEYYPKARIRGIKDMLKKWNLILEGKHHSGINNTKNIVRIAQWLIQNKKILKLTQKGIQWFMEYVIISRLDTIIDYCYYDISKDMFI
jgi:inhibitor of KinA sporulation pathway (predicted exonuclease)